MVGTLFKPRRQVATLFALVFVLANACGSSAPAATGGRAPSGPEGRSASTMLLSAADLPDGWVQHSDGGNAAVWEDCSGYSHSGRTGEATTETFYGPDGSTSLTESVVIYETADGLRAEIAALAPTFDCLVTQLNAGLADTADATFGDASVTKTVPPAVGDKADAYRVLFRVHDRSGATPDSDGYIDGIYVIVGRVGVSIDGNGVGLPLDSALLNSVVHSAIAKVHQP